MLVPATVGATLLTGLWTVLILITQLMGTTVRGEELPSDFPSRGEGWEVAWFYGCYAPLALWGPLLAVLTVAYARRRKVG